MKSSSDWVIFGSGQSLEVEDVQYVRESGANVIAVSNSYQLAPWAHALVSHDRKWWESYPEALHFRGRKFCRQAVRGTEQFTPSVPNGCNSGLMAMEIARDLFQAKRVILLGFDMHGTHFFGPHGDGLVNTTPVRFNHHIRQFNSWHGPEVINCTLNSALKKFDFVDLRGIL